MNATDVVTACLMPAFNLSCDDINNFVHQFPKNLPPPLIILNDHDISVSQHLQNLRKTGHVRVLQIEFQLGKAEALRQGLEVILEDPRISLIAQCDGRCKQPIWQLTQLFEALSNSGSNMIVGNRYGKQSMEGQNHRKAGSGFMSMIIKSVAGYSLPDAVCGMRAYTRELATHFLKSRCFGYGAEAEQLLIAAVNKCNISSLDIESSLQADVTNAEKIEDNLYAVLIYADELGVPKTIRDTLNYILAQIKLRASFNIDLSVFGGIGMVRMNYVGAEDSIINAYTDQRIRDGYTASRT